VIEVPGVLADLVARVKAWRRDASYRNRTFAWRSHLLGRLGLVEIEVAAFPLVLTDLRDGVRPRRMGRLCHRAWRSLRLERASTLMTSSRNETRPPCTQPSGGPCWIESPSSSMPSVPPPRVGRGRPTPWRRRSAVRGPPSHRPPGIVSSRNDGLHEAASMLRRRS
jgi:hypothetical protein